MMLVKHGAKSMVINCSPEQFDIGMRLWEQGEYIQDAFPMLTPDECEFIKTGMLPEEWDALFPKEDE